MQRTLLRYLAAPPKWAAWLCDSSALPERAAWPCRL